MPLKKEITALLTERRQLHINDSSGLNKVWDRLTTVLSENETETLYYLRNCSAADLEFLCEVFDDVSWNLQSWSFFSVLEELAVKFPEVDFAVDLRFAKKMMKETRT